jgi:transcriptional regulator with XRE-family HTH domain
MLVRSHITNDTATPFVRTFGDDTKHAWPHYANMTRRGVPKAGPKWFLREWMDMLGVKQADMCRRTGWSKASASQLYNGIQDYSPHIVEAAALALNVAEYELLMQPERAMAIRRLRETAISIAHDAGEIEDRRDGTNG